MKAVALVLATLVFVMPAFFPVVGAQEELYTSRRRPEWAVKWDAGVTPNNSDIFFYNDSLYVSGLSQITEIDSGEPFFLLRYDLEGNLLWNKSWNPFDAILLEGENLAHYLTGLTYTIFQENIFFAGNSMHLAWAPGDNSSLHYQNFILRYDFDGTMLSSVTWNGTKEFIPQDITVSQEGVFLAGYNYTATGEMVPMVVRMDDNGNTIWNTKPIAMGYGWTQSIYLTDSSIFALSYGNASYSHHNANISKLDFLGNVIWQVPLLPNSSDTRIETMHVSGDAIYIAGSRYSSTYNGSSVLYEYDFDGNELSEKEINKDNVALYEGATSVDAILTDSNRQYLFEGCGIYIHSKNGTLEKYWNINPGDYEPYPNLFFPDALLVSGSSLYVVGLEVERMDDSTYADKITIAKYNLTQKNRPPSARFTVTRDPDDEYLTESNIMVDPSTSFDPDEYTDSLRVKLYIDGERSVLNSEYFGAMQIYTTLTSGIHNITLEIIDSEGLTDTYSLEVEIPPKAGTDIAIYLLLAIIGEHAIIVFLIITLASKWRRKLVL